MPQPGQFDPKGEDWIARKLADLEKQLRELRAANPFGLTGITPQDGGTDFEGYVTINGAAKITGTLDLPAGIIGNSTLTNPVFPKNAHADGTNFSLATGANAEKLRATVTVPAGYTQALVMATATMSKKNTTAAVDEMYLDCRINGSAIGWSTYASVMAGKTGTVANSTSALLTGLGASFIITANASTFAASWASDTEAVVNIDAVVLFLR